MKLFSSSSPLIILVALLTTILSHMAPTVEGRKRKSKSKSEKLETSTILAPAIATTAPATAPSSSSSSSAKSSKESATAAAAVTTPTTVAVAEASSPTASSPTTTTPAPTKSAKAAPAKAAAASTKSAKSESSAKSAKAKKIYFDDCSIANPPYEQAKLITGDTGLTQSEFVTSQLFGKGVAGYLAVHSTDVYMTFVEYVKEWVNNPSDSTKQTITEAGEAMGTIHNTQNISAQVQCTMMKALYEQMKDSCYFKYSDEKEVYVKVASAYMTGFNSKAGDVKSDFVAFCNLGSLWE